MTLSRRCKKEIRCRKIRVGNKNSAHMRLSCDDPAKQSLTCLINDFLTSYKTTHWYRFFVRPMFWSNNNHDHNHRHNHNHNSNDNLYLQRVNFGY